MSLIPPRVIRREAMDRAAPVPPAHHVDTVLADALEVLDAARRLLKARGTALEAACWVDLDNLVDRLDMRIEADRRPHSGPESMRSD